MMNQQVFHKIHELWRGAVSPVGFEDILGAAEETSSSFAAELVRIDQQYRWKTAAPMTVEDYLDAVPEWRANGDLVLEFTAGEFLARLDIQHLPHIGEYIKRFPYLQSQLRQKLSGLSTNGIGNTFVCASILNGFDHVVDVDDICDAFEQVWRDSVTPPFIESWQLHGATEDRAVLLKELLQVELRIRVGRKQTPTLQEYRQRFPDESPFRDILSDWERYPQQYIPTAVPSTKELCPEDVDATAINYAVDQSSQLDVRELDGSQNIGHFRLLEQLGRGAFGRVYRALDEQLDRAIALKVPRRSRFQHPDDAEAYLAEARTVARLNHPGIVPVYQAGRAEDGSVYVVSRLIEGNSLEKVIRTQRPEFSTTARLIADVARALHFAHQHRVIHRDIKPANILVDDATGAAFVADFGLAMKEEDYLKQAGILAGTPAYMSPEQARAEGHRLDGRSDLFSLGVVLYEMLTGKRPFRGSTPHEALHQVIFVDPLPPRAIDETIPAELERICLKAIRKRTSDRYATAELMAEDLEAWLIPVSPPVLGRQTGVQIVPKGLRSFDANDADFFLDLLPGTRNRDGLPESIAFWKQRIEETDPEKTFNVGLIYGPSGCGKSSLVKAGLLPHLSKDVIAVYLEATPDETEVRILRGLKKRVASLDSSDEPQDANVGWTFLSDSISTGKNAHPAPNRSLTPSATGLTETLLHLRRSKQEKIVIIIDQFEQWLHAHRPDPDAELVQALRQCDGVRVQAVVMIRDDFAMAAARFMQALDVAILQGHNFATVDLFEVDHAKNVLIKFGQSFSKLPSNSCNLSSDEQNFVTDVANGLAQDGKVVSVRLSLFVEMIKAKRWTPETLQAVGGTEGIGVNFLEEAFSSPQANPRHRLHATAARAVLKSLLPDLGTNIKGHRRSQEELLKASAYTNRPSDITDLLRILDGELRLITPTDPEGDSLSGSSGSSPDALRFYQLTHDYLVPSLREWLTRKQKETRKGRAELKLEERTALWTAKPENRHLPSLREWIGIRMLTWSNGWTEPQIAMMHRAGWIHSIRAALVVLTFCLVITTGITLARKADLRKNQAEADRLVEGLLAADTAKVADRIASLTSFRDWAEPQLKRVFQESQPDSSSKLHAGLALVAFNRSANSSVLEYLSNRLLNVAPAQLAAVRELLKPHKAALIPVWWQLAKDKKQITAHRFHAACALADFDPLNYTWTDTDFTRFVSEELVEISPAYVGHYQELLRPVAASLVAPLSKILKDPERGELKNMLATTLLAEFAANDINTLTDLALLADVPSDKVLFPIIQQHQHKAVQKLEAILDRRLVPEWNDKSHDPSYTSPSASVRAAIEAAHGILSEQFAFCQDMPWDVFLQVAEDLRASGYRPTRLRPHWRKQPLSTVAEIAPASVPEPKAFTDSEVQTLPATFVAAIWTRDNKRWKLQTDLPRGQLPTQNINAKNEGLVPADVALQHEGQLGGEDTFVIVWEEPDHPDEERRMLINLTESAIQASNSQLAREGFVAQQTISMLPASRDEQVVQVPPMVWSVRYFVWPVGRPQEPPTDWDALIKTEPVSEQSLPDLKLDWQNGIPAPNMPAENFAIEASASAEFATGTYALKTRYDDGVRVYVDGKLVIDHWGFNHPTIDEIEITLTEGVHQLRVEYFQISGGFALSVELESTKRLQRFSGIWSNQGALSEVRTAFAGFERVDQPQWDVAVTTPRELESPTAQFKQQLAGIELLPKEKQDVWQVREARAIAHYQLGNLDAALLDLNYLVSGGNSTASVLQYRTLTLARQGKAIEAKDSLEKFLATAAPPSLKLYVQIQVPAWLGEFAHAYAVLESAVGNADPHKFDFYTVASASALCSQACAAKHVAYSKQFADRTIELLRQLVAQGFTNLPQLKANADYAGMRTNPKFMAILFELERESKYAAVWRADVDFESRLLATVPVGSIVEQVKPLLADGWRPFAVAVDTGTHAPVLEEKLVSKLDNGATSSATCSLVLHRPLIPDSEKEKLALQQSAAATILLRLNASDKVWPLFKDQPDPRLRSFLLHRLAQYSIDPSTLITRLALESDIMCQRSLILGLGEFARAKLLSADQHASLIAEMAQRYSNDRDHGIHGATEWTLRQLAANDTITEIRRVYSTGGVVGDRRWYLTKTGRSYSPGDASPQNHNERQDANTSLTFVILDARDEFLMGSPVSEAERSGGPADRVESRHRRRIDRTFAIGMHEITISQFKEFRGQHYFDRIKAREPDAPANEINWSDAVAYCNWLSEQEGIPQDQWCYDPHQTFEDGMSPFPDYLQRTGYRLPSEAEWEFACRAGTTTSRYFGETETLMSDYAWYMKTSGGERMLPVGSLRPNRVGIFDMLGNALEWCHDQAAPFDTNAEWMSDSGQSERLGKSNVIVLRGGSFSEFAGYVRSAVRSFDRASFRNGNNGFRVARTLAPSLKNDESPPQQN